MHCVLQLGDQQPLLLHEDVLSTMREHHQTMLDQIEAKNMETMLELKGKSDEVSHLKTKVDDELIQVPGPYQSTRYCYAQ